jgi:hypothetical protein
MPILSSSTSLRLRPPCLAGGFVGEAVTTMSFVGKKAVATAAILYGAAWVTNQRKVLPVVLTHGLHSHLVLLA